MNTKNILNYDNRPKIAYNIQEERFTYLCN